MAQSGPNPVVIVTGASRGIGLGVTTCLLKSHKANVVAISRTRSSQLEALASDSLLIIDCDVADEAALTDAIALGVKKYQRIDALILNAAALEPLGRIGDPIPLAAWKKHFDVNVFSLVTALQAALPELRKSELGGRVIFNSSGAAEMGVVGWGPYNASKAAMNSLNRTLAAEESNVVSVAVNPGVVDTKMQQTLREEGQQHMEENTYNYFVSVHAGGQLIKPEDSGRVIAALSLKAPKQMSGRFLDCNGEECRALLTQ